MQSGKRGVAGNDREPAIGNAVDPNEIGGTGLPDGIGGNGGTGGSGGNDGGNEPAELAPRRKGGWPKGKPRGSRTASAAPRQAKLDVNAVERILLSIHFGVAVAIQAPEIQLTEPEAKAYAEAVAAVARHYDIGASAKALDIFNLVTTMGSIYGVRVMAVVARKDAEKRARTNPMANGLAEAVAASQNPNIDITGMRPAGNG